MANVLTVPKTLQEAILYYADPDKCLELLIELRWPDGVVCPYCQSKSVKYMKSVRRWYCSACRSKQFSIKVGTIMEDSALSLDKWLCAIWLITNAKNGISSYEIHRAIGVTQRTAWFLLHRIRFAMHNGSLEKMSGRVEIDETFVGSKEKNKHESKKLNAGRGAVGKAVVMGLLEHGDKETDKKASRVHAKVVTDTSRTTLHREVRATVEAGSELHTDAWRGYNGLAPEYVHQIVDHAIEYVRDNVTTNGLENFWSLLKRTVKGTYVSVDPTHLDAYLAEQIFRFNNRKTNDAGRFVKATGGINGKRLTYKHLVSPQRYTI